MEPTLADSAVRAELIKYLCDELIAIKEALPWMREVYLIEAAYCLAAEVGWGDSDAELREVFRRVADCLTWPTPSAVQP